MVGSTYLLNLSVQNSISTLDPLLTDSAVGDGDSTPQDSDTALDNETFRKNNSNKTLLGNGIRTQMKIDRDENNGNFQREIGTFDDPVAGTMYSRNLTTPNDKTNLKSINYDVEFLYSSRTNN